MKATTVWFFSSSAGASHRSMPRLTWLGSWLIAVIADSLTGGLKVRPFKREGY